MSRAGAIPLPLVVNCPCGARGRGVQAGTWTCEACGQAWDLAGVPEDDYAALVRSVRRTKAASFAGLALVAAIFVPLSLLVSHAFVGTGFVVLAVWYYWYGPFHRKRVRRLYASLPRWQVQAVPPVAALPPAAARAHRPKG